MLKREKVASPSDAQAQSQNPYPKIRERSAKGRVSRASPQPCKPWDVSSAIRFWSKGLGKEVQTPLHLPSMLCGLAGSALELILELSVWVKGSFEGSGLGVCFKHASAKARNCVREMNFGSLRTGHSVMKCFWTTPMCFCTRPWVPLTVAGAFYQQYCFGAWVLPPFGQCCYVEVGLNEGAQVGRTNTWACLRTGARMLH